MQAQPAMKRKRMQGKSNPPSTLNHEAPKDASFIADETTAVIEKKPRLGSKGSQSKLTIQIITGSYEKILHGVTATISRYVDDQPKEAPQVEFADTFLFSAHGSAIRCLAISPPSSSSDASRTQKAILASGGSDQIINLYHISTSPVPPKDAVLSMPPLAGKRILENPRNRELGSLQHHNSSINVLHFPTRSKLLSAAEDNTIAVTRTKDWTVLSTIKAPIPKAQGRPSGDTAPHGGTPAGVNAFAVHPSLKLMVSVGKGEKCMRLWNLITGKKAGVLNFERDLLQDIGEGRWGSGEGKKVEWNSLGEEFAIAFEKGAVVFGMDSKPKCRVLPSPMTKIHQLRYTEFLTDSGQKSELLAVSTEDGRVLFFITETAGASTNIEAGAETHLPTLQAIGQIGGKADGLTSRIKDFEILKLTTCDVLNEMLVVIGGSSDGSLRLWILYSNQLTSNRVPSNGNLGPHASHSNLNASQAPQAGQLVGTYETGNRITCLRAFQMFGPMESAPPRGKGAGAWTKDAIIGDDDSTQSA